MFTAMVKVTLVASLVLVAGAVTDTAFDCGFVVSKAQARIGRPLTPLSYAGVARRTTRRAVYATSVYAATLPSGCTTVVVDGATLHQCGTTYYRASASRYVVVRVD